ncbi:MAG: hypothetical protein UV73_C0002G0029 [Candidatus Gottesmanbacteria bacterium GW2011_GWA2_43_14]|uniref:Ribosomal RNA small subunit methyltransferase I n=1 Tax=Candidatus Gottesmanbacteria bacterium GW2011_GWA2_43_14 TaxID=1618443 RepID=A0A0G1DKD4_9BACT|nr:MAG: hypothetical protein UV73_C0002G0029 [Candidatus Gottesmanbacteria bacterium GW2011_GWA2_43_14]
MGTLFVVATPIGNLEDITIRAINTLLSVDFIACEDTRRTGQLLKILREKYGHEKSTVPKLIPFYDEIEEAAAFDIISLLKKNFTVAMVSDSGTPLIADPGFKLVSLAIKAGVEINSLPGASAAVTALTLSGLPPVPFLFLGFSPPSFSKKRKWFASFKEKSMQKTIIFYESPHRLGKTLEVLEELFSEIEIVVCREMTKIHQEVWRGKPKEAGQYFKNPKGEFVILFRI